MTLDSFLSGNSNLSRKLANVNTRRPNVRRIHKGESVRRRPTVKKVGVKTAREILVADFETTTKEEDCRVWSWGLANIETPNYEDVIVDIDIDSFINFVSKRNSICYFHNLKFDGNFIIYWLLTNDYKHVQTDDVKRVGTFKTMISHMGQFYSITVKWDSGHTTEFRDSLKKLPMTVKRIAQSFGLEESKGDIDYDAERPVGHKLTEEEEDYLRRDVVIIAKAIKEVHDNGMKRLTVASDTMAEYKNIIGKEKFTRYFPTLSPEMDSEIRRAYRGGFTYADPRFKKRMVGSGIVLDVNSLYPSVMMNNVLPYGDPVYVDDYHMGDSRHQLGIFSVTFTAKIKPNHIPTIQIKGHSIFSATEYLTEIVEPVTIMVTNVDWELHNKHYDIDVLEYGGGWKFKAVRGMFDEYINKWGEIKANSTGGKREIAKLHLNSLYGKFASNPNVTGKVPKLQDGKVVYRMGLEDTRAPVYTAVGVFITAYARLLTITAAQDNYDYFAYADTDSLHLLIDEIPEEIDIHPTRMGAWKFEYAFDKAYYIRPKGYMEQLKDGKYVTRIAGLPESITTEMTFDDLEDGKIFHGKLVPKTVPGGVVLTDTPFKLTLG